MEKAIMTHRGWNRLTGPLVLLALLGLLAAGGCEDHDGTPRQHDVYPPESEIDRPVVDAGVGDGDSDAGM